MRDPEVLKLARTIHTMQQAAARKRRVSRECASMLRVALQALNANPPRVGVVRERLEVVIEELTRTLCATEHTNGS